MTCLVLLSIPLSPLSTLKSQGHSRTARSKNSAACQTSHSVTLSLPFFSPCQPPASSSSSHRLSWQVLHTASSQSSFSHSHRRQVAEVFKTGDFNPKTMSRIVDNLGQTDTFISCVIHDRNKGALTSGMFEDYVGTDFSPGLTHIPGQPSKINTHKDFYTQTG